MFHGSDKHAEKAAALFSVIASCRPHSIDPEQYLDEILRMLPYWPKERVLELAPKNWTATRAKLRLRSMRPVLARHSGGVTQHLPPGYGFLASPSIVPQQP